MSARRTTEERVAMVLMYAEFHNFEEVRRRWNNRFPTDPPRADTIRAVFHRFCETGSVEDLNRTGRPCTSTGEQKQEEAMELVSAEPSTSIISGAAALNVSTASYSRIMAKLDFRPYRPHRVPQLSEDDTDRRAQFCEQFLEQIDENEALLSKIVWSDESLFHLSGTVSRHNDVRWGPENPHEQCEVPHSHQSVMVWCGITPRTVIGPYFFDGSVDAAAYLNVLQTVLWPYATHKGLTFQQDGAPAHYALQVRQWLDQKFPNRWIGRRGPLEWPPRSPDLAPCDFFLWGYLKQRVYKTRPSTLAELRERIRACCAELPVQILQNACLSTRARFQECLAVGGGQLSE